MRFKQMIAGCLAFTLCFGTAFSVPAYAETTVSGDAGVSVSADASSNGDVSISSDAINAASNDANADVAVNSTETTEVVTSTETTETTENPPIDMENVTLEGVKTTSYICRNSKASDAKKWGYSQGIYPCTDIVINVNSKHVFNCDSTSSYEDPYDYYDEDDDDMNGEGASSDASAGPITRETVYVTCKQSKVAIENYAIVDNVLTVEVYAPKAYNTELNVNICNKEFTVPIKTKFVTLSTNHKILGKGKSYQLSISGYSGNIEWTSKHPSIATVNKNGKVKGVKYGNAVIIAKTDVGYFGCAVAVCPAKLEKITNRAKYMGNNWKYSQPKRAQTGFYDCSSLVWKAYLYGSKINFGTPYWPGNTWTESAWCKQKGLVKGAFSYSKLNKLKLMPGDIIFKSSNKKKKYATTYHVEMFCGYICQSVDENGNYHLADTWGARYSGYGITDGYIWARPIKY